MPHSLDSSAVALPPRYALAVLITLLADAGGDLPERITVDDVALAATTGYSARSLQLAFQRIDEAGAAYVSRSQDGLRRVTPVASHLWWRIASELAAVTA